MRTRRLSGVVLVLVLAASCSSEDSGITTEVQCNRINGDIDTGNEPKTTMEAVVTLTSPSDVPNLLVVVVQMLDDAGVLVATTRGRVGPLEAGTPASFHMSFRDRVPNGGWPDSPDCQVSALQASVAA